MFDRGRAHAGRLLTAPEESGLGGRGKQVVVVFVESADPAAGQAIRRTLAALSRHPAALSNGATEGAR